jgi:hypothetical protein
VVHNQCQQYAGELAPPLPKPCEGCGVEINQVYNMASGELRASTEPGMGLRDTRVGIDELAAVEG